MSLVMLTLVAPMALKEDLVAAMLAHGPTAQAGFVAREVEGCGDRVAYDSSIERVRGHRLAVEIVVTAPEHDIRSLLDALRAGMAGRDVTWRIAAVTAAGTL
ncbi:conserved hypothetical protein [Rhodopseudomonas palustris HaA2]|uniref:DUF3240 domain-containing protein n=1 Tax=Rhodopseudomonas palustris (strain HaA2) TaxID=316058 RepID=Q2IS30_RHOP2|nr:DUF3240 family protein [Rhodopseudomonas palustris]ABD08980.1 conserved hypothetical protein [Rhodopseudomonas palustris HaA2]